MVATKMSNDLVDTKTGEQHNHALIHTLKVVDNQNFVKVHTNEFFTLFSFAKLASVFAQVFNVFAQVPNVFGYTIAT
jgi:hypothetical protein